MFDNGSQTWLAYFDTDGFETFINVNDAYMEESMQALIEDNFKSKLGSTLSMMQMRGRFNPQRRPRIYSFNTEEGIDEENLWALAEENPQFLADWIIEHGTIIYGEKQTQKRKIDL